MLRAASSALLVLGLALQHSAVHALWPRPSSGSVGNTIVALDGAFNIALFDNAPADLTSAVSRTLERVSPSGDALERLILGRGSSDADAVASAPKLKTLNVVYTGEGTAEGIAASVQKAFEDRDEAYSLTVPADGSDATLKAATALGLFRGLTTFEQLIYVADNTSYTPSAPVDVEDKPAYPYRGFMLDTARNYFPVDDIKRQIDAMSLVKLSQLHWHAVDAQSFPLVIPGFEELSKKGAYTPQKIYTAEDIADITSYAGERGIDVLLEIDTPGHTSVIGKAHPEVMTCVEATPWGTYSAEPPAGQIRIWEDAAINFTANVFSAILPSFPSLYASHGGDEVNSNCYSADPSFNSSGQTVDGALSNFVGGVQAAFKKAGKTPFAWEEMVLDHNVTTLANDTIIKVWISSANARAVVDKGHRIIHAPSDYFYLDCGAGGWVGAFPQGNSWCDPFKTWQKAYTFDPLANITAAQAPLVLGGQMLLWTEQSGPSNVDPIVWPRAASAAEVFWSGGVNNVTQIDEALPRLHDVRYRLVQRGVRAINLQPEWCALRPGACNI